MGHTVGWKSYAWEKFHKFCEFCYHRETLCQHIVFFSSDFLLCTEVPYFMWRGQRCQIILDIPVVSCSITVVRTVGTYCVVWHTMLTDPRCFGSLLTQLSTKYSVAMTNDHICTSVTKHKEDYSISNLCSCQITEFILFTGLFHLSKSIHNY